ncbi:MAG: hypothetical protein ACRDPF_03700 [Streptosporangiaceae bacterium]
MIDDCPPGHLAPVQSAERTLVRARLANRDGYAAAVAGSALREHSTPYHLAHGLLEHAGYLTGLGEAEAAGTAISEARAIAGRLRCQPVPDRAAGLMPAELRIGVPVVTAPGPEESVTARDR